MAARRDPESGHDLDDFHIPTDPHNVFSDDYADSLNEDYADSQDGMSFRRSASIRSLSPTPDGRHSLSHHHQDSQPHTYHTSIRPTHNSISKTTSPVTGPTPSEPLRDPFADSNQDPSTPTSEVTPRHSGSGYTVMAHRSLSASSFAGSQSHASIHDGPSHPYAMYPQNLSMSRTPSVATASTRPASHVGPSSRGPTHPYDSFTQNVPDDSPAPVQDVIQLGFPGASNTYHRRLGPEGEEQDIVGADGHTEQLPPYSRYPEAVHLKSTPLSALPSIGETSPTHTRAPTSSAQDARSLRSDVPLLPAPPPASTSDDGTGLSEKSWKEKSWRERRHSRFCFLPLWMWIMILATILLIIIVCAGTIGGVLNYQKNHRPKHKEEPTTAAAQSSAPTPTKASSTKTQLIDAEPVTETPAFMVPLTPGKFHLDTGDSSSWYNGCLSPEQHAAWSCKLPADKVNIEIDTSGSAPVLSLTPADHDVWYGVQPPNIPNIPLTLVHDTQTKGKPLAFQFQTLYKKLVILRQSQLTFNNTLFPRDLGPDMDDTWGIQEKQLAPDDNPWFCEWPQTFLEVMIYVGNGSTINSTTSMSSSSSGSSTAAATSPTKLTGSTTNTGTTTTKPYHKRGYIPGITAITPDPSSSTELPLPPFCQMVKIEERRLYTDNGGPMPPTCMQMQKLGTTTNPIYKPFTFENSSLIKVFQLSESDPPIPLNQILGQKRDAVNIRDDSPNSGCYCAWNSPKGLSPPANISQAQYLQMKLQGQPLHQAQKLRRWWLDN